MTGQTPKRGDMEQPEVLWVVEMLNDDAWEPTVGVGLTRDDGHEVMADWQGRNPQDRFRLSRYSRV